MRDASSRLGALLLLVITTAPALAAGAPCVKHSAKAEALFDRGRALFDEGRLEEASALLTESERIEDSVGTMGLLAACDERRGHILAAFQEYVATAARAAACGDDREAFAWDRAADLLLRVPRLRITGGPSGARIELRRGGVVVPQRTLGDDIVVDPGTLTIIVNTPGQGGFRREVELVEGARVRVFIER